MKKVILAFFFAACAVPFFAQDCMPDPQFADSVGVFPRPYIEEDMTGGIPDTACLNTFYSTSFTIIVDTISVGGIEAQPDYLTIESVEGLPEGLTYACNPEDCEYISEIPGCATVYGTPTGETGEFNLTISGTAVFFGGAFAFPVTFPNPDFAPGEYIIHVREEGSEACNPSSAVETPQTINEVNVAPNPFNGVTNITVQATQADSYDFLVTDLTGRTVHSDILRVQSGENSFTFDGSDLVKGIYIYSLRQGDRVVSGKIVAE